MSSTSVRIFAMMLMLLAGTLACTARAAGNGAAVPGPAVDVVKASAPGQATAVVAGGCFWGIQAVFEHVKGVIQATSGYSGGSANTAEYETVSTGATGHAESVKIVYDPSQVTYGELLRVFFSVAHDPTELNRQGPDSGTQFDQAGAFKRKIVTQVVGLKAFYPAEAYHQHYATRHPNQPYIAFNDAPKVENLKRSFPELWVGKPDLSAAK